MRLFNILNAILQKCIQFSSEKFQDVSLEYTRKLVNNVHSCRRLAISVGGGIENETIYHPPGVNKPHRCRRPVFTGWADTDTVGVCANLNHAIWLKQIWRAIRHVSKIFLGRSRNRAELRHFRRIRILHRNLVTDSNRLQSFHLAQFACKRCKHALDSYWQGLAPERGWAV